MHYEDYQDTIPCDYCGIDVMSDSCAQCSYNDANKCEEGDQKFLTLEEVKYIEERHDDSLWPCPADCPICHPRPLSEDVPF